MANSRNATGESAALWEDYANLCGDCVPQNYLTRTFI